MASLFATAAVAGFGGPARAQQFSAEVVRTAGDAQAATVAGKLYVSGTKVRIESSDVSDGFFLVDARKPVSYLVRPSQHVFMDSKQSSQLTQLLVPVNLDDPCRAWQAMNRIAAVSGQSETWICRPLGHATVGERDTIAYAASWQKSGTLRAWIDPRLKWPVKLIMGDGTTIELKDIHEQPQPENLFEVPAGYRKFDPKALLERIKQSDVWVEPVH
jgi:hypothetical protein